jgi:hypothetical protein
MDETRVREIIREEIRLAFEALSAAANDLDMPYETSELDSRALGNIAQSADRAAHEFKELCEKADEQRAEEAANPFAEASSEAERGRITHAAAYLPAVDLNALDPGAYKLLGNMARNDPYTNAVIRLVQHGGPRIGR